MGIKAIVESLDEVDEKYHDLYTERDGKFELTEVVGMKTEADVTRLQQGLAKERNDHKQAKTKLAAFGDLNPDDVRAQLDRIPELEAAATGKLDDTVVNKMVETRLASKLAPLQRELDNTKKALGEKDELISTFQSRDKHRSIADEVSRAGKKLAIQDTALEDAILLAERTFEVDEDGNVVTKADIRGVTPGVSAEVWMTDMQNKRPHWWGTSAGGGASGQRGSGGAVTNPWTAENWNMTEQGKILVANRTKAEQLAKSAGTTIGGGKPTPKAK